MRIQCYILKRDRTISTIGVSRDSDHFHYNGGLYEIKPEAVNISTVAGVVSSRPELFYVEGCPIPLTATPADDADTKTFLDEVVLQNAIEGLSGKPGMVWDMLAYYMKDPKKLILLTFAAIIFISFLIGIIPT